jgi:hypothetical protein
MSIALESSYWRSYVVERVWTSNLPEKEAILEELVYDCFERGELSKLVNDEDVDNNTIGENG